VQASERDSSPDFGALGARSRRNRRIVFALLGLLIVGGIGFAVFSAKRTREAELAALASELRVCLLGGPLSDKESLLERFRRLQMHALGHSDTARVTQGKNLWPLTCHDPADRLAKLLKGSVSETEAKAISDLVTLLAKPESVTKDGADSVAAVLAYLDGASPGPVPSGKHALPPAVANVDTLPASAQLSKKGTALGKCYTEDNPGLSLPVLIDEEGLQAPLLCVFRASGDDAGCRSLGELSAVRGHGVRMLGTSDPEAPNLVFAGRRGAEGIFATGTATPIDRVYSYGGYSAKDGKVSVLGWDEEARTLVLVQGEKGRPSSRTPLRPNFRVGNFFYGSQLLWDQVLVRGVTPNDERRLYTLPLGRGGASFELADIGELPEPGMIRHGEEEEPHLTGCRSAQATVVRVRGSENDSLTFRMQDRFTQPVQAPAYGTLGCYGTTATFVRVAHGGGGSTKIFHSACTTAGCSHSVLKGQALDKDSSELRPESATDIAAVDLAGKLLVVWNAGQRGGIRMRMAPPDLFSRADDVMILDDHVWEGKLARETTVLGFRLYSREGFAVLLLSSMAGVHAFRITPDGAVKPWNVRVAG